MRRLSTAVVLVAAAFLLPACVGHTDDATNLTATSATLNAHGVATDGSARAFFRWGTSSNNLTNSTPGATYPANVEGPHAETITGLSPSTTYYFRACAVDNAGTLCAELHHFKTLASNGDAVVAAAGDIGDDTPSPNGQDETGAIVASIAPNKVLILGDNAYDDGLLSEYNANYKPWWGAPLNVDLGGPNGFGDITRPALGNHDILNDGEGAYDFFNGEYTTSGGATVNLRYGVAGLRGQGYYTFEIGNWRLIALNSDNGGTVDQTQLDWLAQRVAQNPKPCLLAYWHHPRWTSHDGGIANDPDMATIWTRLWSASDPSKRADLILNGHVHYYERMARQNLTGGADANGMRQLIVGTGGIETTNANLINPRSEVVLQEHGVLKLTLKANSATGQFLDTAGNVDDSFTEPCH